MDRSPGFFDPDDRLSELSAKGDDLERVKGSWISRYSGLFLKPQSRAPIGEGRASRLRSCPDVQGFDPAGDACVSDECCEYQIKDRLSFIRFLGLGLAGPVPDANTIWTFREALKKAAAVDGLFRRFDEALRSAGFLAMSGQIVDATIVAVPKSLAYNIRRFAWLRTKYAAASPKSRETATAIQSEDEKSL